MKAITFTITPPRWLACKAFGMVASRAYWSAVSGLRLREVAEPELPGDDWVRVRTLLGGICGTDLALIFLRHHPATVLRSLNSFPAVLGHENVGVVESVGSGVRDWSVGQRVCVEPALSCVPRGLDPSCERCREGLFCLCERRENGSLPAGLMIGTNRRTSGSWGELFVAHRSQLYRVPEEVSDEQAVLIDPVAGALHGVLRRRPADGERVFVQGGGIIGLGAVACLRAMGCGCAITAAVRHPYQAELMTAYGADRVLVWPRGMSMADRYDTVAGESGSVRVPGAYGNQMLSGGFDLVYDCIGTGRSLTDAMKFARARGTVVEMGTTQISVIDATPLWLTEVSVLGSYGRQIEREGDGARHTYEIVMDLIRSGRVDVGPLLTHTYRPGDYRSAFRAVTQRASNRLVKAAFDHRCGPEGPG